MTERRREFRSGNHAANIHFRLASHAAPCVLRCRVMPVFVAIKDESGGVMFINLNQIRQITNVKSDYCEVHFSETHKLVFRGDLAKETVDIITQVMAAGPKIKLPRSE